MRDIVEGGRWLLPRTPDGYLSEKPPAYYWAAALAGKAFGIHEGSLRGVSVLAAWVALAAVGYIARGYGTGTTALLAVLILGSNPLFVDAARTARVDMVLSMFLALGMAAWSAGRDGRLRPYPSAVLAGLAWGGAVLSKGPIGAVLPAAGLALIHAVETRGRVWRDVRRGPLAAGVLALAAVAAAFYVPALLGGGREFLETSILSENLRMPLGQAEGIGVGHRKGLFYYPGRQALALLPLLPLLPALWTWLRARPRESVLKDLGAFWTAGFLVLWAAANQRSYYLVPLQGALAVIAARAVESAADRDPEGRLHWAARGIGMVLLLAGSAAALLALAASMDIGIDRDLARVPRATLLGFAAAALAFGGAWLASSTGGWTSMRRLHPAWCLALSTLPGLGFDPVTTRENRSRAFVEQARGLVDRAPVLLSSTGYAIDFYWPELLPRPTGTPSPGAPLLVRRNALAGIPTTGDVLAVWRCRTADRDVLLVRAAGPVRGDVGLRRHD